MVEYIMKKTEFQGFPIQYEYNLIERLNQINMSKRFNNGILKEIGETVPGFLGHEFYPKTEDNYTWFGKLEFSLKEGNVAVLFPWSQNLTNKKNEEEYSINVYSDKEIPENKVKNLLNKLSLGISEYEPFRESYIKRCFNFF